MIQPLATSLLYIATSFVICNELGHLVVDAVGNKDDDPDRKEVLSQDAQKFAAQSGITLFETSAKENVNVEEVSVQDYVS